MLARLIRPSILLQRELQPAIPILANDRHLHTSIVRLSSKNNKAGNNHAESASVKDIKQPFTEKRRKDEISPEARSSVGRQSPTVMDMFSMKGKSVAITGAARGLGNLFARAVVES
ncbi:hypothetical protein FRC03_001575 [Tulasnella sp. 419]|nr:hypothetical protein FRC03_001575 [Tulasnella sp. 419]